MQLDIHEALGKRKFVLIFSVQRWKHYIQIKFYPDMTLEHLENHNKETGLIGSYSGVECYVTRRFKS